MGGETAHVTTRSRRPERLLVGRTAQRQLSGGVTMSVPDPKADVVRLDKQVTRGAKLASAGR
jgi:hypothetical protein